MDTIDQTICFVCSIQPANPQHITDLPVCDQCHQINQKEAERLQEDRIKKGLLFPSINQIIEGKLWLGNYDAQIKKGLLQELGITHVLLAGSYLKKWHPEEFVYHQIEIQDAIKQTISIHFDQCFQFIEKAPKVFVHCHAGVSRSATIVISYLMKKNLWNYQKAFNYVQQKRQVIYPNSGFVQQLKQLEASLKLSEN